MKYPEGDDRRGRRSRELGDYSHIRGNTGGLKDGVEFTW